MGGQSHYNLSAVSVEPIALCERLCFNLGNCVKYLCRYMYKEQQRSDLLKARDYWHRYMTQEEREEVFFDFNDEVTQYLFETFSKDHALVAELYSSLLMDSDTLTDAINAKLEVYPEKKDCEK